MRVFLIPVGPIQKYPGRDFQKRSWPVKAMPLQLPNGRWSVLVRLLQELLVCNHPGPESAIQLTEHGVVFALTQAALPVVAADVEAAQRCPCWQWTQPKKSKDFVVGLSFHQCFLMDND